MSSCHASPIVAVCADDGCRWSGCGSLVGQPVSAIVDAALCDELSACVDTAAGDAVAEFCIAWPPTFTAGGPAESVELRAALTAGACACAATGAPVATGAASGGGGMAAALSSLCGRLLCVAEDVVVAEERMSVDGVGCASARVRLASEHPGVTSCVLSPAKGMPSLQALRDSAPLLGLPPAAREEAHRLLWRMMHEALPPAHSELPFDPEAFASPLASLPAKLQAALCWAWTHHFRAFAQDWSFLLEYHPPAPAHLPTATMWAGHEAPCGAAFAAGPETKPNGPIEPDASADYGSVMVQMASFLRDNRMFACLATLLQSAVERGMRIEPDGSCSFGPQQRGPEVEELACHEAEVAEADDGYSWLLSSPLPDVLMSAYASADNNDTDGAAAAADCVPPLHALLETLGDEDGAAAAAAACDGDGAAVLAAEGPAGASLTGRKEHNPEAAAAGPDATRRVRQPPLPLLLLLVALLVALTAAAAQRAGGGAAFGVWRSIQAAVLPYGAVTLLAAAGFRRLAGALRLGAAAGHATLAAAAALAAAPVQALASAAVTAVLLLPVGPAAAPPAAVQRRAAAPGPVFGAAGQRLVYE
ncbi:hypothetical protein GPECTOR_7g1290 [Gonium pectorale]|uniref:Uncharacterized protein n=1 Tax=Gonium pectorale TaxID=33097 RepID=A0A150GUC9_GONPE|nr:hypothetical protein GPECTOR_7g1290 [Gonium pectorale]|eukprot:KXZ53394.1 hypothetical protein GPECTOR_7g1290 [Gonium pectorale]